MRKLAQYDVALASNGGYSFGSHPPPSFSSLQPHHRHLKPLWYVDLRFRPHGPEGDLFLIPESSLTASGLFVPLAITLVGIYNSISNMSRAPSADITGQMQGQAPGRSQVPDGVDYASTASAPPLNVECSEKHHPRRGIDDVRTQQVGFIERPSPGASSDDERFSTPCLGYAPKDHQSLYRRR